MYTADEKNKTLKKRNADELIIRRTLSVKIDKMPYYSYMRLWNQNKYKAGGNYDGHVFLPALKSCLLNEHKYQNKCTLKECYSCQVTRNKINQRIMKLIEKLNNRNVN